MPGFPRFKRNAVGIQPRGDDLGKQSAERQAASLAPFYGEMPMPATAYVSSTARLQSLDVEPSIRTRASNASVVDREWRMNGMRFIGGRQSRKDHLPQMNKPVDSSTFQHWLIGPQVNFVLNDDWYIAYPAATISFGTMRNLAWSEKVPQLPTRTTGGPGPAAMGAAPRFRSVQTVPRYSTMPTMYNTESTQE